MRFVGHDPGCLTFAARTAPALPAALPVRDGLLAFMAPALLRRRATLPFMRSARRHTAAAPRHVALLVVRDAMPPFLTAAASP